ncbi:helix-turn-helix domain-containing protein [Actinomadura rupiterrae]|uniref:helix-turn-helix domain-containing protein n=1 Tax=Actinomadura rupiterrae TaxID=559627 RepID=UPI0027E2E0E8|nr:helix-turn-helix transcriptional regulator [Actinomadura rupiterrae]
MEPPEFWSHPVVARALATCDMATLLEEIRKARGWTQADLGEALGYTQSWASKVLRGDLSLTLDQVRVVSRTEPISSSGGGLSGAVVLEDGDGLDEVAGLARAAAQFPQDAP